MEFWFSEKHTDNVKMSVRVENSFIQVPATYSDLMFLIQLNTVSLLLPTAI